MSPTTIMTVSTRGFVSRSAVLAVSALAHVLLYGALSLVPASTPPARPSLIVAEVVLSEPTPPAPVPQPVTPPRPLVRAKPRAKPAEVPAPPKPSAAPPTSLDAPPPPADAALQSIASAETPREVTTAPPPPTVTAPSSDSATSSSSGPASTTMSLSSSDVALSPPVSAPRGSAAAVAALPPGPVAGTSAVTRTAIPRGGYQVTPSYPASARRLGIEGTALLRVFVDAAGHVGDVVVKQSAGHPDLDRAAADAVRRWRFDPARRGADAVAMWVELPVEFHLR